MTRRPRKVAPAAPLGEAAERRVVATFAGIADLHWNPLHVVPQGRTETYHEDCTAEWEAFLALCHAHNVVAVLIAGDIFNLKNPRRYCPADINHYAELIRRMRVATYAIPGNHDLLASSLTNYGISAFKTLVDATANLHNVTEDPQPQVIPYPADLRLHDGSRPAPLVVRICGQPYYDLENAFGKLLDLNEAARRGGADLVFAMTHLEAIPKDADPLPGSKPVAAFDHILDELEGVDVVVGGHVHTEYAPYSRANPSNPSRTQWYLKPWAMGRVWRDTYATSEVLETQHKPTAALIRLVVPVRDGVIQGPVEIEAEYAVIPYAPPGVAFKPEKLKRLLETRATAQSFHDRLMARMSSLDDAFRVRTPEAYLKTHEIPERVLALIENAVAEVRESRKPVQKAKRQRGGATPEIADVE